MKHQLSSKLASLIREKTEEEGNSIYEQYSGRGMYGAKCFGITISRHSDVGVVQIIMNVLDELHNRNNTDPDKDDPIQEMLEANWKESSDNLGMDMIYYFPKIEWSTEEETVGGDIDEDEEGG